MYIAKVIKSNMKTISYIFAACILMTSITANATKHKRYLRGDEVYRIQKMMNKHSSRDGILMPKSEIDGVLGPITANVIEVNLRDMLYNTECTGE